MLSEDGLSGIQSTAHRLLDQVGIRLDHPEARELLGGLGCRVNHQRVTIPGGTVAWALENVTPQDRLYNRDGTPGPVFDRRQLRAHNGGGQPLILDLSIGKRRPATLSDLIRVTRLLDALPNVDQVTPLFGASDVPLDLLYVASTDAMLRNTSKPISSTAIERPDDVPYLVEMAAACCGGTDAFRRRPTMSISVSPVSPLTFTRAVTGAIMAVARSGAPLHPLPSPTLAATGPITLAGALAQQHAENLASFLIAAAARPGVPVMYCSRISPIDLRTAVCSWGGPEVGMAGACAAQIAHRLGFPCDTYGLASAVASLDAQCAYERLANALVPALGGADILSGVGLIGGLAGSLEAAVIDDEMIGLIKHVMKGCRVDDDTLAFEVMSRVISTDATFLSEEHTVRHTRAGAIWTGSLGPGSLPDDGNPGDIVTRASARVEEILGTHEVEPLRENVSQQLDDIREAARCGLLGG
ncbi:MAG: trimethylamine methyltransferase family protein [Anaerolineae bacterium]|jgi:trimethylamine--corrinoid protein Co-methyltransferase